MVTAVKLPITRNAAQPFVDAQQFVQDTLPSMLRKAYKAKKAESIELMVQLRRIVCDWNGNNGEEPNNLYELKDSNTRDIQEKIINSQGNLVYKQVI